MKKHWNLKRTPPPLEILPLEIPAGETILQANLVLPENAEGLVIVARVKGGKHGHLCDHSIARTFSRHRLAALLVDLSPALPLSLAELSERLRHVAAWTQQDSRVCRLPLGCLGIGTAAAAALLEAAKQKDAFQAVVSLAGYPELAATSLPEVKAPALMITGNDPETIRIHQEAINGIGGPSSLHVIPHGLSTLQETGSIEDAAQLASLWFSEHFGNIRA